MVHLHLHLHRPLPLNLLSSHFSSRSHSFSIKIAFFKQRRLTAYASASEGRHLQNWNGDQSIGRKGFGKGCWKKATVSWNHVVTSCNSNYDSLMAADNDLKEAEHPLMLSLKVVSGLLGLTFVLVKIRGLYAKACSLTSSVCLPWFVSNSRMALPVATPFHLGQFSSLTSALDKPSVLWAPMFNLGLIKESMPRFSYILDTLLERHPITYILLLTTVCLTLICVGGILFTNFRSFKQKPGDSFWDAWACICSSNTHLKEKTGLERGIGLVLAVGGLLFYSLLTSTMTAQFKVPHPFVFLSPMGDAHTNVLKCEPWPLWVKTQRVNAKFSTMAEKRDHILEEDSSFHDRRELLSLNIYKIANV